jgi:3-deoxy-7-phosphoheptulonate synthase
MTLENEDGSRNEVARLVAPRELEERFPRSDNAARVIGAARRAICDLLTGRDRDRLLVVVGPCSIHDRAAALEYARRLQRMAEATREELVIVMRTYFEKPRTTVGWKGLINDPHLDGSCDVSTGLELARSILLEINELGVPCACELLDPIAARYVADLVSWAAVGARTSESQPHREMASGLAMPVGFKNGTDGNLQAALNAMVAARHPHRFVGVDADGIASVIGTPGNPYRHIILRGGTGGPNHTAEEIQRTAHLAADDIVTRPIVVDCSHDNSQRDHTRQAQVCREVLADAPRCRDALLGVMLESNLHPGRQPWSPGRELAYGVSITDACISWEETEALLYEIAESGRGGGSSQSPTALDNDSPFP